MFSGDPETAVAAIRPVFILGIGTVVAGIAGLNREPPRTLWDGTQHPGLCSRQLNPNQKMQGR